MQDITVLLLFRVRIVFAVDGIIEDLVEERTEGVKLPDRGVIVEVQTLDIGT